jgi:hypothetical protein
MAYYGKLLSHSLVMLMSENGKSFKSVARVIVKMGSVIA